MAALNVLVYSGPGVGLDAHAYLMRTLRQFLSHRYAVIPVGPETLGREPWESKAAVLVVPGGRDLPYTVAMNGRINERIKAWVHKGGRYLGFCAGGYYGSARCEFEPHTSLEVVGDRELALFRGTCVGGAYPGYSYKSEDGARAVEAIVERDAFNVPGAIWQSDPTLVRVYYNGGGFFLTDGLAGREAGDDGVSVLVRFPPDVTDPYDRSKQIRGAPAVISCKVGAGSAILSGLHPEYAWDFLAPSSYTQPHNRGLVSLLRSHDASRRRLLGAMLRHLGLDVDPEALVDCPDPQHSQRAPRATPMFLVPARASSVADIANTLYVLNSIATQQGDRGSAGAIDRVLADTMDDIHVANAATGDARRRVDGCYQDAVLRPEDPGPPPPSTCATATVSESGGGRRHSLLVLCTQGTLPGTAETPRFNMHQTVEYMRHARAHTAGSWLMYADTTWSTQTFLEKNLKLQAQLPDGMVFVATRQLAGRGRGKNAWISPAGCLQFTMLVRHPDLKQAPVVMMQYLMSLAVVEAVKALPGYEGIPLRLKWPNDIYALLTPAADSDASTDLPDHGFAKIGGVLVSSSYKSGEYTLLFGCGINVANRLPTTSINSVIREYNSAHGTGLAAIPVEKALALITAKFEELYRQFLAHGFEPLLKLYYRSWLHSDQVVTLADRDYEQARVVGLGSVDGQLRVRSLANPGATYSLQPDGNSFDMLQGLISRRA
ncbi:biotin holocarboxylase synthetase [Coemansia biformis]|uniref:Biotin holocarboxylase synthetase n=1 Tax=Coemansia biformis TaxID=1286918 RepID=A0A9W8D1D5_9FUNG|nr:biotin holocarboxylase synthetase [Coemansia biformis]